MKKNSEMQKIHQNWATLFHILALKNWRQKTKLYDHIIGEAFDSKSSTVVQ